jgi:heme-degrading monooxygenase HmoA
VVVEHALFSVAPDKGKEFESAFKEAEQVLAQAKGFEFVDLLRGCEGTEDYLLIVAWDSLDDSIGGFRNSGLSERWNQLVGPFLTQPAKHVHFDLLSHYTGTE